MNHLLITHRLCAQIRLFALSFHVFESVSQAPKILVCCSLLLVEYKYKTSEMSVSVFSFSFLFLLNFKIPAWKETEQVELESVVYLQLETPT